MASEKYMESLMEVASDYELMSNEMFRLAHKLEDMPRYNPHHEMYSLVRNAEQATSPSAWAGGQNRLGQRSGLI